MALNGIDISSWQAGIDLSKVPADFVIIKATEGTNYVNPDFKRAADQTIASGKLLGIYHFAGGGNPQQEADYFVNAVKPYIGKAALFLDFEAGAINDWGANGAKQWLDYVASKTGVNPILYTSASVTRQFDWSEVAKTYGLWRAQYPDSAPGGYTEPWTDGKGQGAWQAVAIYQYENLGQLPGYAGNLDLDQANMTREAWGRYAAVGGQYVAPTAPTAPAKPVRSIAGQSLETLASEVQAGLWGSGNDRANALGQYAVGVQAIVNERAHAITAQQSHEALAGETKAGKYGNGNDRQFMLGSYYQVVQDLINGGAQPAPVARTYTVVSGDSLSGIGSKLGVNWQTLAKANGIVSPYKIYPGQKLDY